MLPDPIFRRENSDVLCEVPITIVEAALGAQLEVPTLDGRVRMKLPAGTQSGRVFRLRGKGVPNLEGGGRGDQHVTVIVETPRDLTEHERSLLENLRQIEDDRHYPQRTAFWEEVEKQK